jgi:hypothetical protein
MLLSMGIDFETPHPVLQDAAERREFGLLFILQGLLRSKID